MLRRFVELIIEVQRSKSRRSKVSLLKRASSPLFLRVLGFAIRHTAARAHRVSVPSSPSRGTYPTVTEHFSVCRQASTLSHTDISAYLRRFPQEHREVAHTLVSGGLDLGLVAKDIEQLLPGHIQHVRGICGHRWEPRIHRFPLYAVSDQGGLRVFVLKDEFGIAVFSRSGKRMYLNGFEAQIQRLPHGFFDCKLHHELGDDEVQRIVRRNAGTHRLSLHIYDHLQPHDTPCPTTGYKQRRARMIELSAQLADNDFIRFMTGEWVKSPRELRIYAKQEFNNGSMRVIVSPDLPYFYGNSWAKVYIDKFVSAKATVIGFERGDRGSFCRNGLGRLIVKDNVTCNTFRLGTGFTRDERADPESWIGRVVIYEHKGVGSNGLPKFPVFRSLVTP